MPTRREEDKTVAEQVATDIAVGCWACYATLIWHYLRSYKVFILRASGSRLVPSVIFRQALSRELRTTTKSSVVLAFHSACLDLHLL